MLKLHSSFKNIIKNCDQLFYIATLKHYKNKHHTKALPLEHWHLLEAPLSNAKPEPNGKTYSTYTGGTSPEQVTAVVLPDEVSRYNSLIPREQIFQNTKKLQSAKNPLVIIAIDDEQYLLGASLGIARHIRLYGKKSESEGKNDNLGKTKTINLGFCDQTGKIITPPKDLVKIANALAFTCQLVDMPGSELAPDTFSAMIKNRLGQRANIKMTEIAGKRLITSNLMGIHSVGKGATHDPRLVLLDYHPRGAKETIALVGKGITFDSGGLSLKISGSMVGMKTDMAGAGAVIGAFDALTNLKCKKRVIAAVGLAENAIGPLSYKVDDIITLHSNRTVEIGNTDAEGRLVLADAISYVARKYKPDMIIDIATLTGAQLIATGRLHGALISNKGELEDYLVQVGKKTGDLVAPLPFAPEIFMEEFKSELADMKNTVKDRANAQTSCAAHFLYRNIDDLDVSWAHIDMAGPASCSSGLSTGYGVGLLLQAVQGYNSKLICK